MEKINAARKSVRTKSITNKFLFKYVIFVLFAFQLVSCHTRKIALTECDHPSGWCKEIRVLAAHSWKYAQLCKNVYNKAFTYQISDYFEEIQQYENREIGFYAALFRDKSSGEYTLAFRGTDEPKDFRKGNNPFNLKQQAYALKIYDEIIQKYNPTKMCVAGHSLGGALATHVSLNREKVKSYSFNGSPVFKNDLDFENLRYSIVETGEILKIVRMMGRKATQEYTSIGCSKGGPIKQHDMQRLATCLTRIATAEDPEALKSLAKNNIKLAD